MKTKIVTIAATAAALLFACGKQTESVIAELTLDKETIITSAEEKIFAVEIFCNTDWSAAAAHDWVELSAASGNRNGTLTITVRANTTDSSRENIIEIFAGKGDDRKSAKVTVTQAGGVISELTLDKETIITSAEEKIFAVEIFCNTDWSAAAAHDWVELSAVGGNKNGTLTITVRANTTDSPRESVVEIVAGKDDDRKSVKVIVAQIAAAPPAHAKTGNIWIVGRGDGMQVWSDAISLPRCDKSDFNGRNLQDGDCRNNPGYGYLYSWIFVNKNGDALCPDGWRVPSTDDFAELYNTVGSDSAVYHSDIWGGEWAGACDSVGGLGQQDGSSEVAAHYWTSTNYGNPLAYYFSIYASGHIFPKTTYTYDVGFQVRCVREY